MLAGKDYKELLLLRFPSLFRVWGSKGWGMTAYQAQGKGFGICTVSMIHLEILHVNSLHLFKKEKENQLWLVLPSPFPPSPRLFSYPGKHRCGSDTLPLDTREHTDHNIRKYLEILCDILKHTHRCKEALGLSDPRVQDTQSQGPHSGSPGASFRFASHVSYLVPALLPVTCSAALGLPPPVTFPFR